MHSLISNGELFQESGRTKLPDNQWKNYFIAINYCFWYQTENLKSISQSLFSFHFRKSARDTRFLTRCTNSPDLLNWDQISISTFLTVKVFKKGSEKNSNFYFSSLLLSIFSLFKSNFTSFHVATEKERKENKHKGNKAKFKPLFLHLGTKQCSVVLSNNFHSVRN